MDDQQIQPPVFLYSDKVLEYNFGPKHPLQPVRYRLTNDLIDACGLFSNGQIHVEAPRAAEDGDIELVHEEAYVETVRTLGRSGHGSDSRHGFGRGDNPVFPEMHEVTALVAGGSIQAAQMILRSEAPYAFNVAGGLHHAMPSRASGFCIYNDPAIAIAWLLKEGLDRVAYIDTDAHHGDGVQWIFYDDPRVLTCSIHESGKYLFPGTGSVDESGGEHAKGSCINVPLDPYASDADIVLGLTDAIIPAVQSFKPQAIVLQHGCDIHHLDPLTHLECTMKVFPQIGNLERLLADDVCEGRALAGGGGGYAYREVVPRAWLATMAGFNRIQLPELLPKEWRARAGTRAVGFLEDVEAPAQPLESTKKTISELHAVLGIRAM